MSGKRDLKELERRRLRAAELLRGGMAQAEVARACGVSRNAVSLWARALAAGHATELWSLGRVGKLIERCFGPRYSPTQVWRILGKLGWSCQRPGARAIERDERAIRRWKQQRWPALKKTPPKSAA